MKGLRKIQLKADGQRRRPITLASVLVLVALVAAACGQAAPTEIPPTQPPAAAATAAPAAQSPAAAPSDAPAPTAAIPAVTVSDQEIVGGKVTIAQVVSAGPGWLVIHAEKDGAPGAVIGYSAVKEGDNADVAVVIDPAQAGGKLYAMLHSDGGTVGVYEFPGPDGPVTVDGKVVTPVFAVTGGLAAAPTSEPASPSSTTASPSSTTTSPSSTTTPQAATPPAATPAAGGGTGTILAGEAEVELEDFQMAPKVVTVRVGTTVKFSNKDRAGHTVTSDTGLFDSGMLAKGEEFFYTFTQAGEYPYYCAPHGGPGGEGMAGMIIVVP